jgi:hypothetical protein
MFRTHAVKARQMREFAGLESFGCANAYFKNIVEASVTIDVMPAYTRSDHAHLGCNNISVG